MDVSLTIALKRTLSLQLFNNARVDYEWGKPAIFAMVEIYLNIDNDIGWEEGNQEGSAGLTEESIKIAQKLLNESRQVTQAHQRLSIRPNTNLLIAPGQNIIACNSV